MKNYLTLCVAYFAGMSFLFAQVDSLEALLPTVAGEQRVRVLKELCYQYSPIDVQKAIRYGEEARQLAATMDNAVLRAGSLNDLAIAYFYAGQYPTSLTLNEEALAIRRTMQDTASIIASLAKIGNCWYEIGDHTEALPAFQEALQLSEMIGADAYATMILNNIGSVYKEMEEYAKALEMHEASAKRALAMGDTLSWLNAEGNRAIIFQRQHRLDLAEELNLKLIPIIQRMGDSSRLAIAYHNLGVVYEQMGHATKRRKTYRRALELYREVGDLRGEGEVAINLGRALMDIGEEGEAMQLFRLGRQRAYQSGALMLQLQAHRALSALFAGQGRFDSAFSQQQHVVALTDSQYNKERSKALAALQVKFETARRERALANRTAELSREKLRVRSRNFLLMGSALVLLLVVGGAMAIYYQQRQRQRFFKKEAELQAQLAESVAQNRVNEERTRISRELHDNIGAQLSVMMAMMESPQPRMFDELREYARRTMRELRRTVWIMNHDAVTVEEWVIKLQEYLWWPQEGEGPQLSVQVEGNSQQTIAAEILLHLFRAIQEAVNNALKYAEANTIAIQIEVHQNHFVVAVRDDGIGFDMSVQSAGHGLQNMHYRLQEVDGRCDIQSKPGKGTVVQFTTALKMG